jgi:hypothetical protein
MRAIKILLIILLAIVSVLYGFTGFSQSMRGNDTPPVLTSDREILEVSVKDGEEAFFAGITATDKQDGDLTDKVQISGISKLVGDNTAKITNPAFKSLYRLFDKENGMAIADLITVKGEEVDESKPLTLFHPVETWKRHEVENFHAEKLLKKIIEKGKLVYEFPTLQEIQAYSKGELAKFWEEYLRLDVPQVYKVDLSDKLHTLKTEMIANIRKNTQKAGK